MNHDELIDVTLATLRSTTPPAALEDRLLTTLESAPQRVPHPGSPTSVLGTVGWHVSTLRHGWTTNLFPPRLWLPTSLAAAILAIVVAIHLHRSTPTQTPTANTAAVGTTTTPPTSYKFVILSEAQRSRSSPRLSTDLRSQNLSASAPAIATSSPTLYEQAALADTLAPSHPAPPLPLTKQERLLLRCTRRGQPLQVAELDLNYQQSLRPAASRDAGTLQEYVKGLLHTLVGFQPLEPAPPTDEALPALSPAEQAEHPISSH